MKQEGMNMDDSRRKIVASVGDMSPWESVEANRPEAHQIGRFTLGSMEYTRRDAGEHVKSLWLEKDDGEGMEVRYGLIPEGVTEAWLADFWEENF
jgi:hypothetical protein